MKKTNILLTAIIFALALISCSQPSEMKKPLPSNQAQVDTSKTEVEAAYVCPMGKECGSGDKPGKCPSCGMEMKPSKKNKIILNE